MEPNPYEASKATAEPPDEPIVADVTPNYAVQRALSVGVPFLAGVMAWSGLDGVANGERLFPAIFFTLSAAMLAMAWRWTR